MWILSSSRVSELQVWKKDVYMTTNAMSDMLRQEESPTRGQRKVMQKDQLRYWRSLYNWVVCLKILIRESLFYVNKENLDQNTSSNSPRTRDIKKNIGKQRVHREELSKSVRLMSVVLASQTSENDHMRRLCNKNDVSAENPGTWQNIYMSKKEDKATFYSLAEAWVMLTNSSKSQKSDNSWSTPQHRCTCWAKRT